MRKLFLLGIVATAYAVMAADNESADQTLVRLKIDGKVVAELTVLDAGALSVSGEQVTHVVGSGTITAEDATPPCPSMGLRRIKLGYETD
jgi:hypothetical protein